MANITWNVRHQLKYDTYQNLIESTFIPLKGEPVVCEIDAATAQTLVGEFDGNKVPSTAIKVGDGSHKFSELKWIQAVAGDVYAWAKAAAKPDYTAAEIAAEKTAGDGKKVSNRLADIESAIEDLEAGADEYRIRIGTGADVNKYFLEKKGKDEAESAYTVVSTIDLTDINSKVTTLIGDDANKSVRTIANEELAAQLIPASAKEALDTLQEIAAWIQNHPDDAAAMNAKITALKNALSYFVTVDPQTGAYTVTTDSVKTYVDTGLITALAALADTLTGTPGKGKTLTAFDQVDGKVTATFEDILITLAQVSDAGAAAALDVATSIGANADNTKLATEKAVKDYADGLIADLDSNVAATAADGNKVSVLTKVVETDGKLTGKEEVQLEAVAKTGNVNDLIQTSGDYIILNGGTASTVI